MSPSVTWRFPSSFQKSMPRPPPVSRGRQQTPVGSRHRSGRHRQSRSAADTGRAAQVGRAIGSMRTTGTIGTMSTARADGGIWTISVIRPAGDGGPRGVDPSRHRRGAELLRHCSNGDNERRTIGEVPVGGIRTQSRGARHLPDADRVGTVGTSEVDSGGDQRRRQIAVVRWVDSAAGGNPFAEILRSRPKDVATRSRDVDLPHPNSVTLRGESVDTVGELRDRLEGNLVVLGSGMLVRSLAAAGLIDGYRLTVLPLALGSGTRLFDRPSRLRVEHSTTSRTASRCSMPSRRRPRDSRVVLPMRRPQTAALRVSPASTSTNNTAAHRRSTP